MSYAADLDSDTYIDTFGRAPGWVPAGNRETSYSQTQLTLAVAFGLSV